jgi:ribose transport system permease protein
VFGSVIGLLIPSTLQNGFVILGVQSFWQQVVVGAVLIAAVYVDQARRAADMRGTKSKLSTLFAGLVGGAAGPARE